jgi:hypothetical protein
MSNTAWGSLESGRVAADAVVTMVRRGRSRMKVMAAARATLRRSRRWGECGLGCGHGGGEESGVGPWRVTRDPDLD